jgi:hypothetical protein
MAGGVGDPPPTETTGPLEPPAPPDAAPQVFGSQSPHEDDVRIAGATATFAARQTEGPQVLAQAGMTGGTATLEALPMGAPAEGPESGPEGPRDEVALGPGDGPEGMSPYGPPPSGPRGGKGSGRPLKIVAVAAGAVVAVGGGAVAAFALTGDDGGKTVVKSSPLADAAQQPRVDTQALAAQREKEAVDRASRAARKETAKRPDLQPKGTPIPTRKPEEDEGGSDGGAPPTAGNPVPAGKAQEYAKAVMDNYGFSPSSQFGCLRDLWDKESDWNYRASNPSGAYGIPQALPGSKMASEGDDWRTNYKTQIRWGLGYIKSRHETPCGAWNHSQTVGWY